MFVFLRVFRGEMVLNSFYHEGHEGKDGKKAKKIEKDLAHECIASICIILASYSNGLN